MGQPFKSNGQIEPDLRALHIPEVHSQAPKQHPNRDALWQNRGGICIVCSAANCRGELQGNTANEPNKSFPFINAHVFFKYLPNDRGYNMEPGTWPGRHADARRLVAELYAN